MELQSGIVCSVCKLEERVVCKGQDYGRKLFYKCKRCRRYSINSAAKRIAENHFSILLSAWIREKNDFGSDPPEITSEIVKNIRNFVPNYSPSQKQLVLL